MTEKVYTATINLKTVAFIFAAVFMITGGCLDGLSRNFALPLIY